MGFGVVVRLFRCLFIILRRTSLIEELIRKERKECKVMESVTLAAEASQNLRTRKATPPRWFADVLSAEENMPC